MAGLRALGFSIETASINPPDRAPELLPATERAESATTFYLKSQSWSRLLPSLLRIMLTSPSVAARGLKAALALQPGHLTHTLYALFYWAEALLLGDWMRSRGLAHLHIHFSGPVASVGMLTSLAWNVPYSLTVHGPDEFFDQNEMALAQKVRNAAFVICISDFCRSQLMRISPPDAWKKLYVVRLGISPQLADRPAVAPTPNETPRPFHILCTGRLVGAKGQGILLLAASELMQRGHRLHLTLIGDGVDRPSLERIAHENGISASVTFAGAQNHSEALHALHGADLFVLPSFAEGVPVALMEAMAVGVPVISTFIAGIPELIRHEQDGLLVPAGSVEALTAAIERMLLDPKERERFRASAREHVLAHYNLPRNLRQLAGTFAALAPHALRSSTETTLPAKVLQ